MQGPAHFNEAIDRAFESCEGNCSVAAVGGFVGSDLFTYWENAIKTAAKKYPNVKVVVDEPANFDPRIALTEIQSALLAHPEINIIISSWDDMSRGVEQAVIAAGKKQGKDVKIFSGGATKVGIAKVKAGTWTQTTAYLPYQEAYYGAVGPDDGARGQADQRLHRRSPAAGDRQQHRHDFHHQERTPTSTSRSTDRRRQDADPGFRAFECPETCRRGNKYTMVQSPIGSKRVRESTLAMRVRNV